MSDPIYYDVTAFDDMRNPGGWYFWDETWSHSYGPYATEKEARQAMSRYIKAEIEKGEVV